MKLDPHGYGCDVPGRATRCAPAPEQKGQSMSNKDEMTGRAKKALGDLADDDELRREGQTDEAAGKVKDALKTGKDKLDDAVDAVKEKVRGD
jgi:uncharacterized protein YjbJ (UPF0337 family)